MVRGLYFSGSAFGIYISLAYYLQYLNSSLSDPYSYLVLSYYRRARGSGGIVTYTRRLLRTKFYRSRVLGRRLSLVLVRLKSLLLSLHASRGCLTILFNDMFACYLCVLVIHPVVYSVVLYGIDHVSRQFYDGGVVNYGPYVLVFILYFRDGNGLSLFRVYLCFFGRYGLFNDFLVRAYDLNGLNGSSLRSLGVERGGLRVGDLSVTRQVGTSVCVGGVKVLGTTCRIGSDVCLASVYGRLISGSLSLEYTFCGAYGVSRFSRYQYCFF